MISCDLPAVCLLFVYVVPWAFVESPFEFPVVSSWFFFGFLMCFYAVPQPRLPYQGRPGYRSQLIPTDMLVYQILLKRRVYHAIPELAPFTS
jgi:hypothetical protein